MLIRTPKVNVSNAEVRRSRASLDMFKTKELEGVKDDELIIENIDDLALSDDLTSQVLLLYIQQESEIPWGLLELTKKILSP